MPLVNLTEVISFSSQDDKYTAENLLTNKLSDGKWLISSKDKSGTLEGTFQLQRATVIDFLDIGNCGSACIAVWVSRSSSNYVSFLPAMVFMTPIESKLWKNCTTVRMFSSENFNQEASKDKWDRIKVVCTQPYNKSKQFGLSFLRVHSSSNAESKDVERGKELDASEKRDKLLASLPRINDKNSALMGSINLIEKSRNRQSSFAEDSEYGASRNTQKLEDTEETYSATVPIPATEKEADMFEVESLSFLESLDLQNQHMATLKVSDLRRQFEAIKNREFSKQERQMFLKAAHSYVLRLNTDSPGKQDQNGSTSTPRNRNLKSPKVPYGRTPESRTSSPFGNSKSSPANGSKTPVSSGKRMTFSKSQEINEARHKLRQQVPIDGEHVDSPVYRNNISTLDVCENSRKENVKSPTKRPSNSRFEYVEPSFKTRTFFSVEDSDDDISDFLPPVDMCVQKSKVNSSRGRKPTGKSSRGGRRRSNGSTGTFRCTDSDSWLTTREDIPESNVIEVSSDTETCPSPDEKPRLVIQTPDRMVTCPLCNKNFPRMEIQEHAFACTDGPNFDIGPPPVLASYEECPVCGDVFETSRLSSHAAECAEQMYGM